MAKRAKATDLSDVKMDRNGGKALGQQVVGRVLELIQRGSLRAGDRLPPERELIDLFGISRPILREALRALSTLGVVRSLHGGGAYVSDLDARTLLAPLDFYLSLTKSNLADAFDSRRVIEIEIVRRATLKATRADLANLRGIIEAHGAVHDDPVGFRILDSRFHETISEIAGNAVLQRIAYGLYNLGVDFQNFDRRARAEPKLIAQSTADHGEIVAAIIARDPEQAARAMSDHIRNIELSTLRVISRRRSPPRPIAPGRSRSPSTQKTIPSQIECAGRGTRLCLTRQSCEFVRILALMEWRLAGWTPSRRLNGKSARPSGALDRHDQQQDPAPRGEGEVGADVHQVEAAGDHLQDPERNEETDNPAEPAVRIHASENRREYGDQQIRLRDIGARRIKSRHHDDRRQPAQDA